MKLNKKGFGVAEIAIVVLLIGILAAAVIAGFMGIKKNAHDSAESQKEKAEDIIHATKHAYPTILSTNQEGLVIGEGEYEVYELGGYSITGKAVNGSSLNSGVINQGTLFITGNGTLDKNIAINSNLPLYDNGYTAIENYGDLTISDIVVIGGGKYSKSVNQCYAFACYGGSTTTINNIYFNTTNGGFYATGGATLDINGTNTVVTNTGSLRTGAYLFIVQGTTKKDELGKVVVDEDGNPVILYSDVVINDGKYSLDDKGNNTYMWINTYGRVTINNAIFSGTTRQGFIVYPKGYLEINGGVFKLAAKIPYIQADAGSTVVITGGEFISDTSAFIKGTGNVSITGGAFYIKPKSEWLAAGYSVSQNKQSVVCSDGVTRQLYVVTKNS